MGACMSSSSDEGEQKKKSQIIDRTLEEDSKRLRRECKILLLGMYTPPTDSDPGHDLARTIANYAIQDPERVESRPSSSR